MKNSTGSDIDKIKNYFINVHILKGTKETFLLDNKWAKDIYNSNIKDSYIMNVEGFIDNNLKATKVEQFVYLDLLSKRNVFTFYNTRGKVTYLTAWKAETMYDLEKLKANRLLNIDENNIYFVYEQEKSEWV
jgi:hypothetical protein